MADRENELRAEKESAALKKLQAAAGLIDKSQTIERLDWMYEQSVAQSKPGDDDKLMNMPVAAQSDKDIEDVKKLGETTAGSLFLKSATKTTEDVLRKLREDPLFQIKRQEQAARESAMANPLIRARVLKKEEKQRKKEQKKVKKAAKKEKKALKKAAKKEKKAMKKASSDSSDSSNDSSAAPGDGGQGLGGRDSRGAAPPPRPRSRSAKRERSPKREERSLGPSSLMLSKREEHAAQIAERRDKALASRGAASRMSEEEKRRKVEQMQLDATRHGKHVDSRIAAAEQREKEIAEREKEQRANSDQKYFRDMRTSAYAESNGSLEDRMKSQRHRRQKHINDPLERDN